MFKYSGYFVYILVKSIPNSGQIIIGNAFIASDFRPPNFNVDKEDKFEHSRHVSTVLRWFLVVNACMDNFKLQLNVVCVFLV